MAEDKIMGPGVTVLLDTKNYTDKPGKQEFAAITRRLQASEPVTVTAAEFAAAIADGQTWCGGCYQPNADRTGWGDLTGQQVVALDFDNHGENGPLHEGERGFISPQDAYARCMELGHRPLMIYLSFSATLDNPRFRVVFRLDDEHSTAEFAECYLRLLLGDFPEADHACTNHNRLFLGTNGDVWHCWESLDGEGLDSRVLERMAKREREAATIATRTAGTDPELKDLEAGLLLPRIQTDTGEEGKQSGDRIAFEVCPICGHRECFFYYPATESWSCFSASNTTGRIGGDFITYVEATDGMTRAEAIAELRWLRGDERPHKADKGLTQADIRDRVARAGRMPEVVPVSSIRLDHRPAFIEGIIRPGAVALLAGPAKVGKTFLLQDLTIAALTGQRWLGYRVQQVDEVLFLNPEVQAPEMAQRFRALCDKRNVSYDVLERVKMISLRNKMRPLQELEPLLTAKPYQLVVIDTVSTFLNGEENDSGAVRDLLTDLCNPIAEATGGVVVVAHHMRKCGAEDGKATSSIRGSSVWTDAPDAILTLSELYPPEGEEPELLSEGGTAYRLSFRLRSFATPKPVTVLCQPPTRFDLVADGVTDDWTTTPPKRGAKAKAGADPYEFELLYFFKAEGIDSLTASEARDVCIDAGCKAITSTAFKSHIETAKHLEVNQTSPQRWEVRLK